MKKKVPLLSVYCLLTVGLLILPTPKYAAAERDEASDRRLLLLSYLKITLIKELQAQAGELTNKTDTADGAEITGIVSQWTAQHTQPIRSALQAQFGDQARPKFEEFVRTLIKAEQENDKNFPRTLAADFQLADPASTLRSKATAEDGLTSLAAVSEKLLGAQLQPDVDACSRLLSEIEMWSGLRKRDKPHTPSLSEWLKRNAPPAAREPLPENPLAAAEAPLPEVRGNKATDANPADSYSSSRKAKEAARLKDALAGMEQVAAERKAAEEEYAAKKLAQAQAESAAMQSHAQDLVATEKQALEQLQHTWGARLKKIAGTALGSFGGAVLGGVGSRLATETVDAIFND